MAPPALCLAPGGAAERRIRSKPQASFPCHTNCPHGGRPGRRMNFVTRIGFRNHPRPQLRVHGKIRTQPRFDSLHQMAGFLNPRGKCSTCTWGCASGAGVHAELPACVRNLERRSSSCTSASRGRHKAARSSRRGCRASHQGLERLPFPGCERLQSIAWASTEVRQIALCGLHA